MAEIPITAARIAFLSLQTNKSPLRIMLSLLFGKSAADLGCQYDLVPKGHPAAAPAPRYEPKDPFPDPFPNPFPENKEFRRKLPSPSENRSFWDFDR